MADEEKKELEEERVGEGEGEGDGEEGEVVAGESESNPSQDSPTDACSTAHSGGGIPKELLVKHPLQYKWVLWYLKNDRAKQWEECLKKVATFNTVEDFWALYNHIQLSSGLSWGSDYYLFKEGIKPMWEDPRNVQGGRWLIVVDKQRRNELLDHYWLELLMAVIGEQFDDLGEEICGAVVNIRNKGDKVSLWTRNADNDDGNKRIGQVVKAKLDIQESIRYEAHSDTSVKTSSVVKPRIVA